jgi:putative membrane protein insertion efficiency factor
MKAAALFLIRVYQATLSPLLGQHCRFHPTCSDYMSQAIARHGFAQGGFLGLKRIFRCHPFHKGGFDPVP